MSFGENSKSVFAVKIVLSQVTLVRSCYLGSLCGPMDRELWNLATGRGRPSQTGLRLGDEQGNPFFHFSLVRPIPSFCPCFPSHRPLLVIGR